MTDETTPKTDEKTLQDETLKDVAGGFYNTELRLKRVQEHVIDAGLKGSSPGGK